MLFVKITKVRSLFMSLLLKHGGLAALSTTTGFPISPLIKPQKKTVDLSFKGFLTEHLSPFKQSFA